MGKDDDPELGRARHGSQLKCIWSCKSTLFIDEKRLLGILSTSQNKPPPISSVQLA